MLVGNLKNCLRYSRIYIIKYRLQPSGTCNFSRIDNATLSLTLSANAVANNGNVKVKVFAVNSHRVQKVAHSSNLGHYLEKMFKLPKLNRVIACC